VLACLLPDREQLQRGSITFNLRKNALRTTIEQAAARCAEAADAFRLALDLCACADSTKGAADFDVAAASRSARQQRCRRRAARRPADGGAGAVGARKDLIAAALALDVKTACRVSGEITRTVWWDSGSTRAKI
jgi:hypothetical protein